MIFDNHFSMTFPKHNLQVHLCLWPHLLHHPIHHHLTPIHAYLPLDLTAILHWPSAHYLFWHPAKDLQWSSWGSKSEKCMIEWGYWHDDGVWHNLQQPHKVDYQIPWVVEGQDQKSGARWRLMCANVEVLYCIDQSLHVPVLFTHLASSFPWQPNQSTVCLECLAACHVGDWIHWGNRNERPWSNQVWDEEGPELQLQHYRLSQHSGWPCSASEKLCHSKIFSGVFNKYHKIILTCSCKIELMKLKETLDYQFLQLVQSLVILLHGHVLQSLLICRRCEGPAVLNTQSNF